MKPDNAFFDSLLFDFLNSLLTDAEAEALIHNFAQTRGKKGITEQETAALLSFAKLARFETKMIDLTIRGLVDIDWRKEKPLWKSKGVKTVSSPSHLPPGTRPPTPGAKRIDRT